MIATTPKLLGWSLLSALVTSVLLFGIVAFFWPRSFEWAHDLVGTGGWRSAASAVVGLFLFTLSTFLAALTLPNVVLAPLQDPLSETTEERLGGFQSPPFSFGRTLRSTVESLQHTALRLGMQLLGIAVLWPLNLIPGAGSVLWATLGTLWSMFCLAAEHLSNPMARHLYPFRTVFTALRKRLAVSLGLGAALYIVLWIPVLNFFLMPVAVVSGTLLFRSLRATGVIDPPRAQTHILPK